ncbi:TetR/AcrR family transcriptional regulator [Pyruvatibacter mobilis]|uniref:TetR/AcrR family transcriptional regulator n=1 Tax=Pyruvatibacter mobilis TaxID=1712261 RepID=UPI003C7A8C38
MEGRKLDWSLQTKKTAGDSAISTSSTTADTTSRRETRAATPDKRSLRKARTRRHIYEAAMQLFAARGYDDVRIEEICEAAGIAKATFFLHFGSKAALIEEFNAQLVDRLARDLADETATAEARLRRYVDALVEEWEGNAEVVRQMSREFLNQPALMPAAEAANRSIVPLVQGIIADGQRRGEFAPSVDAALAATMLVSTWGAFAARWSDSLNEEGRPADVGKLHHDLLDLVLGGLTPRAT